MRIFIGLTICLCVVFVGYQLMNNYKKKINFYEDLVAFLNSFKNNINFNQDSLIIFIQTYSTYKTTELKVIIDSYLKYLIEDKIFDIKISFIEDDEKTVLERIFTSIGKNSSNQEIKKIENYIEITNDIYNKSKMLLISKGQLSFKLSICFGLVLLIMFA